jgi:DNA repair exonuclease SbcCD ATPase subunit
MPSIDDLLPRLAGTAFQKSASGWLDGVGSTSRSSSPRGAAIAAAPALPPPLIQPHALEQVVLAPEAAQHRRPPQGGVKEFASIEAVNEAVAERTTLLTRIFQEKLSQQSAALEGARETEARAHAAELRQLKTTFEERLTEAVEKVRAVHATNRDAVSILQANKRLRVEATKRKQELDRAVEAQHKAEERERARGEEAEAVVQQLMSQLQEKESLLAAGAGAMTEDEREQMLDKERARAQQAAAKERERIEAAMAEERSKAMERMAALQEQITEMKHGLEEMREKVASGTRALEKEKKAHAKAEEVKERLEVAWNAEAEKRARLAKLEVAVNAASSQIVTALTAIRNFLKATEQHLKVDLSCLNCLGPLDEPQVLVPCGHSICTRCSKALDAGATITEHGASKYCPVCEQYGAPEMAGRRGNDDSSEMPPVEAFPNTMLDTMATRLRTKSQDVQALLNFVFGIFDEGAHVLPNAEHLRAAPTQASTADVST